MHNLVIFGHSQFVPDDYVSKITQFNTLTFLCKYTKTNKKLNDITVTNGRFIV